MKKKTVMLATGGTGGHVFPAIAVAQILKENNVLPIILIDNRGAKYAKDYDFKMHQYTITNYLGSVFNKVKSLILLFLCFVKSILLIIKYRPAILIGFGGYSTIAPCLAAYFCGVKFIIHEQNSVLGKANEMLLSKASSLATSFYDTYGIKKEMLHKAYYTGNFIRQEIKNIQNVKTQLSGKLFILILGGSQAAEILTLNIANALLSLDSFCKNKISVIHQVPEKYIDQISRLYKSGNIESDVKSYFDNLNEIYQKTSLIISRSGASTISEIEMLKIPSILVPITNSVRNHQYLNAEYLVKKGAAIMMTEKKIISKELKSVLFNILSHDHVMQQMSDSFCNQKDFNKKDIMKVLNL